MDDDHIIAFRNSLDKLNPSTITINQNGNIILIHKYDSIVPESSMMLRLYVNTPDTGYRYTINYIREFYLKLNELGMLKKVKDELRMELLAQM